MEAIQSNKGFEKGDNAWLGASDMPLEGSYSWMKHGAWSKPFFGAGASEGKYTNWADGEPNGANANHAGRQEEDCVAKYGGGDGKWNDQNCYVGNAFFVVKFDKGG